jgi:hypothetical protein
MPFDTEERGYRAQTKHHFKCDEAMRHGTTQPQLDNPSCCYRATLVPDSSVQGKGKHVIGRLEPNPPQVEHGFLDHRFGVQGPWKIFK